MEFVQSTAAGIACEPRSGDKRIFGGLTDLLHDPSRRSRRRECPPFRWSHRATTLVLFALVLFAGLIGDARASAVGAEMHTPAESSLSNSIAFSCRSAVNSLEPAIDFLTVSVAAPDYLLAPDGSMEYRIIHPPARGDSELFALLSAIRKLGIERLLQARYVPRAPEMKWVERLGFTFEKGFWGEGAVWVPAPALASRADFVAFLHRSLPSIRAEARRLNRLEIARLDRAVAAVLDDLFERHGERTRVVPARSIRGDGEAKNGVLFLSDLVLGDARKQIEVVAHERTHLSSDRAVSANMTIRQIARLIEFFFESDQEIGPYSRGFRADEVEARIVGARARGWSFLNGYLRLRGTAEARLLAEMQRARIEKALNEKDGGLRIDVDSFNDAGVARALISLSGGPIALPMPEITLRHFESFEALAREALIYRRQWLSDVIPRLR